ncbi:fumarylacetoacetate hydrolase family protein [Chelativorans sp.]|uniref:fumarylacetoacetate hydrolase family protein n=1 Tax=Chelativorans sp. TaxID=2203393 RepID=UPI0028119A87|nr:fumarylacetoacetate hydrolase family protein [Chelativorans sp.]
MKIASVRVRDEDLLIAEAPGEKIVSLPEALQAFTEGPHSWVRDMLSLIEAGPAAVELLEKVHKALQADPDAVSAIAPETIQWYPPVRRPSKICCLALNNSANSERIMSGPKHPAIFVKGANALAGHDEPIIIKEHYGRVHPEPELAVIIAKTAKDVKAANAMDYVFGYTIHNDITSPTMRGEDTFHYRAIHPRKDDGNVIEYVDTFTSYSGRYKCSDTFSPMGPWIILRDHVPDPHALAVRCDHKGELVTEDSTLNLTHKIPQVLEFITGYMTMLPGDIISMGTALKPVTEKGKAVQNVDLRLLGGPISVSIERIGTLSNTVSAIG